ncbi:MAG: DMT family transporter, partial [Chloroflexi bacterium]|nr:DMT family transporter [Chloroflexota bacterium]
PVRAIPNMLYSGILAGVGGFLSFNYAIKVLGPTRASAYFNFNPVLAAAAGVLLLDEPLTIGLVIGGALTLGGVIVVRNNTLIRPSAEKQPQPGTPAPVRSDSRHETLRDSTAR